jgi:hypothetical protein
LLRYVGALIVNEQWSKSELIKRLTEIRDLGWVPSGRTVTNVGGVGNTLEDLLGIKENNLPLANAGKWELKAQTRLQIEGKAAGSYTTLFHFEPEPREVGVVTNILLPKYGWPLNEHEVSFRVSMFGHRYTDRGFKIDANRDEEKLYVDFNSDYVDPRHHAWLKGVEEKAGLEQISPQPYWSFDKVRPKVLGKCANIAYILADSKKEQDQTYYSYNEAWFLSDIDFDKFVGAIETGGALIDFDARSGFGRSGHNHGTKFRLNKTLDTCMTFYDHVKRVF